MLFFSEREYGHHVFVQCFNALDSIEPKQRFRKVAQWLDISEQTLRKYYRGDLSPPRAVVYAIWHESTIGQKFMRGIFSQQDHWQEGYTRALQARQKRLESEVLRLQNILGTLGAANDAFQEIHKI